MPDPLVNYFMVWARDRSAQGPVELSTVAAWIEQGRLTSDSWVFTSKNGAWQRARKIPELKTLLSAIGDTVMFKATSRVDPGALRTVKIMAGFNEAQLNQFARLLDTETVPKGAVVITQGQSENVLYLILDGELKVTLSVIDKQVLLTTLQKGDFFGEIAFLSQGTRSANVTANTDCLLARLTTTSFEELSKTHPDIATPFIHALNRAIADRIRADNQRLTEFITSSRQIK